MNKINSNTRYRRFIFYLVLFMGALIYIAVYTDSIMFFNIQKVKFSLKEKIELKCFDIVVKIIEPDNGLKGGLNFRNNLPYFSVPGFEDELLSNENKKILKRKGLHPSQRLALLSMGFGTDYFLEMYRSNNLNKDVIDQIEQIYSFVYSEINNPLSMQSTIVNDHAISERIQFIVLLNSYLQQYYPKRQAFINKLDKDFNICLHFLLQNNQFTWRTNHGIMQLRSLAQVAAVVKLPTISNSILKIVDERLTDITPFMLGSDGAVYEASSSYWGYIYNQLKKISEIDILQYLPSVIFLKTELPKVDKFINTVAANDGYMQGVGDGYSFYLSERDTTIATNRYFIFSNGLAGVNWAFGESIEANVLFYSLNTPPNVHKLPEDLMLTIYLNKPYFVNTGTYSYNSSETRKYFTTNEEAHSTVYFKNNNSTSDSSKIIYTKASTNTSVVCFIGIKYYANQKYIQRTLKISPAPSIEIHDNSNTNELLITQFILHPDVEIKRLSPLEIELINADSIKLLLTSNCSIELKEAVISPQPQQLIKTTLLQITGDSIHTMFTSPDMNCSNIVLSDVSSFGNSSKRLEQSIMLSAKYKNNKGVNLRTVIISQFKKLMFMFLFIIALIEIVSVIHSYRLSNRK